MTGPHRILKVGLTGGIAAGKTTVAGFLRELGACVIDADEVAHLVMAPGGSAFDEVVGRFGKEILGEGGVIDRSVLAKIVFRDSRARQALNAIVHPRVRAETARRIAECAAKQKARLAVYDAALLVETGVYRDFHRLIVVRCSAETQVRRLRQRDGLEAEAASVRIASQASLNEKLAAADYVIDTDVSIDDTRRRTEQAYAALLRDFEREFS